MRTDSALSDVSTEVGASKSRTRYLPGIARVLMGLPLVAFGLNGFLNFIPPPPTPLPEDAAAFLGALAQTGYMVQLIAVTHLLVAVLLLTNRFVPLALALFAPFIVNSIVFHLLLERSGLPMAAAFLVLELYLAWSYRNSFRPMLAARVPTVR